MTAFVISKWILASAIAAAAAGGVMAAENSLLARDGLPEKYVKRIKQYQEALESIDNSDVAKSWLGLSEQLRAIDKWNPARFALSW